MAELSPLQRRNIAHTILELGHANPMILKNLVLYRDQTPGYRASMRQAPIEAFSDYMDEEHFWTIDKKLSKLKSNDIFNFVEDEELDD